MSLANTHRRLVARRAVGGMTWQATRPTDNGVAFAAVPVFVGEAQGYLYPARQEGIAVTLPGQPAPAVTWRFTRTGGAALQTGDELAGAEGVRCRLGPKTAKAETETWEATRL